MKKPNATIEVMKAMFIRGYNKKYEFETEDEAKAFSDRVKKRLSQLPEYLRPNINERV